MTQAAEPRTGVTRRHRGQAGQSLIEVIIAVLLMGSVFGVVAGALFTTARMTTANENLQLANAAIVSYGQILQSQVPYSPCPTPPLGQPNYESGYYLASETFIGNPPLWRRPANVIVSVTSVRTFDVLTGTWGSNCNVGTVRDSGVQIVRYRVVVCKNTNHGQDEAQCQQPVARTGEIVKRRPGPS